jgi:hypothetical protein
MDTAVTPFEEDFPLKMHLEEAFSSRMCGFFKWGV